MIAEVMDDFDFEKVHKVMLYFDWKWKIEHDEFTVPSIFRMMKTAERLLTDVSAHNDKERHEIATGGFRAIFDENENLELRFELVTSESLSGDYGDDGNCIYK